MLSRHINFAWSIREVNNAGRNVAAELNVIARKIRCLGLEKISNVSTRKGSREP